MPAATPDLVFGRSRPENLPALARHLEDRYGIRISRLAPIDDDPATRPRGSWPGRRPATLVLDREDGPSWIARVHSSPADTVERVRGDARILRYLQEQDYPAERPAAAEPVSVFEGAGVLVTELLPGGRPGDGQDGGTPSDVHRELGALLGRLHALPRADGAMSRDGGAEEADGGHHVGRPGQDLVAARSFLAAARRQAPPEADAALSALHDQLDRADDAEGLPEALTHANFHAWAAVGVPGALSIVGWAGSGRGPRLPALAWLLRTAAEVDETLVDAVLDGYREHSALIPEEIDRLPGVLTVRPLWLACLDAWFTVRAGGLPDPASGWAADPAGRAHRIAARVADRLAATRRPDWRGGAGGC